MNIHAQVNPSPSAAMAGMEAVDLNNQALQLSNRGDNAGAERLHRRALALKESAHGPHSIQAAITLNALGEVQMRQGKLVEAEENLRRAIAIRNSGGPGAVFDAAVSRESLAQVMEAKGDLLKAREIRDQGAPDKLVCGNYKCPGQMFTAKALQRCSRCRCVYYCTTACQRADWGGRHKNFCRALE